VTWNELRESAEIEHWRRGSVIYPVIDLPAYLNVDKRGAHVNVHADWVHSGNSLRLGHTRVALVFFREVEVGGSRHCPIVPPIYKEVGRDLE